jgi:putative colanic acid biosynthesis UDP-glucose lipid carrier transferase
MHVLSNKTWNMNNRYKMIHNVVNVIIDYFLLNLSLIIVYNQMNHSTLQWLTDKTYLNIAVMFNLLWLLAANICRLYKADVDDESKASKKLVGAYTLYVGIVCYVILFLNPIETYFITREFLFNSMTLFGVILGFCHFLFSSGSRYFVLPRTMRKAIIVGGGKAGMELYNHYKNNLHKGYQLMGMFDDEPSRVANSDSYLGTTSACMEYVRQNKVDEILCALPYTEHDTIERLIKDSDKNLVRFKLVPDNTFFHGSRNHSFANVQAVPIRVEPLEDMVNRAVKRLFDMVFASLVIVFILSWLFPIIYFLIKMESPGPVFFIQTRSGLNNIPFNCFKFRSMRINKDSDSVQATKGDSRITKLGAFLRKTSLDELPQFFNVLMGNMSVVGPRPHMLSHTEQYSQLIDQFMVRHFIKPGITGWAQVTGYRGETKTVDAMLGRVEADVWYMENWSFMLDLKIILMTVFKSVYGDKQAY